MATTAMVRQRPTEGVAMTALKLIRYGSWAAVAALGLIIAFVLLTPERKPGQTAGSIGGAFRVAQATGGELDSATLAGKPYGLFFGFTQCPDVCPGTLSEVTQMLDELDKGSQAERSKAFRVLFVTVDPERDTPDVLKSYLSAFDGRIVGLVPSLDQLPGLARQFAAYYKKEPTSSGYTMNHTSAVYLFDAKGQFSGTLDIQESMANRKLKMERLLGRS
jgi:protein SCO1